MKTIDELLLETLPTLEAPKSLEWFRELINEKCGSTLSGVHVAAVLTLYNHSPARMDDHVFILRQQPHEETGGLLYVVTKEPLADEEA